MKSLILGFVCLFAINGFGFSCSKAATAVCPAVVTVATSISNTLSNRCQCDQAAVYKTLYGVLNVGGMCPGVLSGNIANAICPVAVNLVTAEVQKIAAQSDWKCANIMGPACIGGVSGALLVACEAIPLAPESVKH